MRFLLGHRLRTAFVLLFNLDDWFVLFLGLLSLLSLLLLRRAGPCALEEAQSQLVKEVPEHRAKVLVLSICLEEYVVGRHPLSKQVGI